MSDTASNSSSSSTTAGGEQDEFEKMKNHKQESLKASKEYVESQGKNFVTRDERWLQ